jgi:hypothetical protein
VVVLSLFSPTTLPKGFFTGQESHAVAARYYRLPHVSLVDAVLVEVAAELPLASRFSPPRGLVPPWASDDGYHPGPGMHAVAADLLAARLGAALLALLGQRRRARALGPGSYSLVDSGRAVPRATLFDAGSARAAPGGANAARGGGGGAAGGGRVGRRGQWHCFTALGRQTAGIGHSDGTNTDGANKAGTMAMAALGGGFQSGTARVANDFNVNALQSAAVAVGAGWAFVTDAVPALGLAQVDHKRGWETGGIVAGAVEFAFLVPLHAGGAGGAEGAGGDGVTGDAGAGSAPWYPSLENLAAGGGLAVEVLYTSSRLHGSVQCTVTAAGRAGQVTMVDAYTAQSHAISEVALLRSPLPLPGAGPLGDGAVAGTVLQVRVRCEHAGGGTDTAPRRFRVSAVMIQVQ